MRPSNRMHCLSLLTTMALCAVGITLAGCPVVNPPYAAIQNSACLACHDGRGAPDQRGFEDSLHAASSVNCEDCHGSGLNHVRNGGRYGLFIENPADLPVAERAEACATCHGAVVTSTAAAGHPLTETASCGACHNVHSRGGMNVDVASSQDLGTPELAMLCGDCHETAVSGTAASLHGSWGFLDCLQCHGDLHDMTAFKASVADSSICVDCHSYIGFGSDDAIDAHTGVFHSVEASRCTGCHMVPVAPGGPLGHTMLPVPPSVTIAALEAGDAVIPPNSCVGVAGCHDPNVPGSGQPRDLNDLAINQAMQGLYELIGEVE